MERSPVLMQGSTEWFLYAPGAISGRQLRYLLTTFLLESPGPLSVRELVALCQREGVVFQGRPSKIVSDALRWEIGWGRVSRLSRGIYWASKRMIPRSTGQWIAKRVVQLRVYLAALRAQTFESVWPMQPPRSEVLIT